MSSPRQPPAAPAACGKRRTKPLPALILACAASAPVWAEPVVPDRPGFSTGTATVAPGTLQIEGGIQVDHGPPRTWTAPQLNLRTGLDARTELNLLWDGIQATEGKRRETATPLIGVKRRLRDGPGLRLSALGYLSAPHGRLAPLAALLWERDLSGNTGLFGAFQLATTVEAGERQTRLQPAMGAAFAHGPAWGGFVELYADIPLGGGGRPATTADAGLAWLPHPHVQLDLSAGLPVGGPGDRFVSLGIAVKL